MPSKNLKIRHMLAGLGAVESGARIVVAKAIPLGEGKMLLPGEDVTEQAKTWPTLSTHIKRGALVVIEKTEESPAQDDSAPSDALDALRTLTSSSSKAEIKAALTQAGLIVPTNASRDLMLRMVSDAIKA